jgi:hypothetical protein
MKPALLQHFLSVGGEKYGVDAFTTGGGGKIVTVDDALYNKTLPMCWAGRYKTALHTHCKTNNLNFYNLDSGYFSSHKLKTYFRVSKNSFQNIEKVTDYPANRWNILDIKLQNISIGSSIVIVPPDEKKLHTENLAPSVDDWIKQTIFEIKKYSDRPIRIRQRPASRGERIVSDTFLDFISKDTYCVIGHSSNALVEAAMNGIPVISLGESATRSLYNSDISKIEKLTKVSDELKMQWIYHLSYSQFTRDELIAGIYFEYHTALPTT